MAFDLWSFSLYLCVDFKIDRKVVPSLSSDEEANVIVYI